MNELINLDNENSDNSDNPLDIREIVELGAIDSNFFASTFFPKTLRMRSPAYHDKIWSKLDGTSRLVSLQIFRGGSKTTICRTFAAKKVAYAQARTILWVGRSQDKAVHSVKWLRKQVEYNSFYRDTFQLRPGSKWQDLECEIYHGVDEVPITILAYGVTGSVRGINVDDYRPDLILLDDIIDEENAASPMQREKIEGLVYGAFQESLAPASEAPDAKMVMLQTPIDAEDMSMQSLTDPAWDALRVPCWTIDTENLPLRERLSAWEERYPSVELRKEKENAIARNKVSIFSREKECRIVTRETSSFLPEWIRYYDLDPPDGNYTIIIIDPVPPPSEAEIKQGMKDKDYECITVMTRLGHNFYLRAYEFNHGHDPSWTIATFFTLATKYRPQKIIVESVAYQRTLAWILRQAMQVKRQYFHIHELTDKRKKFQRIIDGLNGPASEGHLFVKKEHTEFVQQFYAYPNVAHDDIIETVAVGCAELSGNNVFSENEEGWEELAAQEAKELPRLPSIHGAP